MTKPILVGSRGYLGLEIEVSSWVPGIWACVRLWIGGKPLGREDNPVALYALMNSLDGILKRPDEPGGSEMLSLPAEELWERFETAEARYHAPTTEFFDDYNIYCVSDDQTARFMWMARYWDPDILHDVRVPRGEVARTLNDLHAVYENLCRNP